MLRSFITAASSAALAVVLSTAAGGAQAATTPTMDGKSWLVAQPELTGEMGGAGSWRWVICGVTQPPYNGHCPSNDVPAFGSYWKLKYAIEHPAGRTTFWLDQEGWSYTPWLEREHPDYYLKLAGQLAARHHVTLIEAPVIIGAQYNTPAKRRAGALAMDEYAARYAQGIDLQDQAAAANPADYLSQARQFSAGIRAAARSAHHYSVLILDNLSTDPGGHVVGGTSATPAQSAAILHSAYEKARPYVDGFWFETPTWTGQGPTAGNCDNSGCSAVASAFLKMIGA